MGINISQGEHELFKDSEEFLGENLQLVIAIEEMSELIKVITKYQRGSYNESNFCEELSHVVLMCNQLISMFKIEDGVHEQYSKAIAKLYREVEKKKGDLNE